MLDEQDWLCWNLKQEVGRNFTKKVPWAFLFAYICWDIWTSRCRKIFNSDSSSDLSAMSSFLRACWDWDLSKNFNIFNVSEPSTDRNAQVPDNFWILETDGSVLASGSSGCGGVVKKHDGQWILGYSCKLVPTPPAIAEVMAILNGLHLCWQRGCRNVFVFSDCIEALQLLIHGCQPHHPFFDIISETRLFTQRNWDVHLQHRNREFLVFADYLARISHSLDAIVHIFDQPPPIP